LTDLGFPSGNIVLKFEADEIEETTTNPQEMTTNPPEANTTISLGSTCTVDTIDRSTAIIGGCVSGYPVSLTEVFSKNNTKSILDNPASTCLKPAGAFWNDLYVFCVPDAGTKVTCYSYAAKSTSSANWLPFTGLEVYKERFTLTASGAHLVIIGGSGGPEIYVFDGTDWNAPFLDNRFIGLTHHAAVGVDNDEVFVTGGFVSNQPSKETFLVNHKTNQVTEGIQLPETRYAHSSAVFTNKHEKYVVVAGGFVEGTLSDSTIILKICNNNGLISSGEQWIDGGSLKNKRYDFGLGVVGTTLKAFGGIGDPLQAGTDLIEVYNPSYKKWEFESDLSSLTVKKCVNFTTVIFDH